MMQGNYNDKLIESHIIYRPSRMASFSVTLDDR